MRLILVLFLASLSSACVTSKPAYQDIGLNLEKEEPAKVQSKLPSFNRSLFEQSAKIPSTESIVELPQHIKEEFNQYFNKSEFVNHSPVQRVGAYIGLLMDQLKYSENTYTATEVLQNGGGNCLSLTVLTTAIAKLADVELEYQQLVSDPTFALDNDVLISSDHMRVALIDDWQGDPNSLFNSRDRITIDYFDTQGMNFDAVVSTDYHQSLFYSNRAVEFLIKKQYDESFVNADRALSIYSKNEAALNTMAILHRRLGDAQTAEAIYQFGIAEANVQAPVFIRNYLALLKQSDRMGEYVQMSEKYESLLEQHPLEWLRRGNTAHAQGDFLLALEHYETALNLAPGAFKIYLYSARSALALGDKQSSLDYLHKAISESPTVADAKSFKRKAAKFKHYVK